MAKAVARHPKQPITTREYTGLQAAFDFFNAELFGNKLPDLVITLQRKAHSRGHFASDRFAERIGAKRQHHELNLNPDAMFGETDERIVSTLVHEQVHLAQFAGGKAPSKGYHNKDWARRMKEAGLYPSSTGAPGGRETGQRMTHYVIPGGPFQVAFKKLAKSGWKLGLQSAAQPGRTKAPPSKIKYECPECGLAVWGKPGIVDVAHVGECKVLLQAEGAETPVVTLTEGADTSAAGNDDRIAELEKDNATLRRQLRRRQANGGAVGHGIRLDWEMLVDSDGDDDDDDREAFLSVSIEPCYELYIYRSPKLDEFHWFVLKRVDDDNASTAATGDEASLIAAMVAAEAATARLSDQS
jgi:hypothetical protein